MTRAMGFLTGVCLTVAMFVLVLERWQHRGQETAAEKPEAMQLDAAHSATQPISEGDCFVAPLLATTGRESASVIARNGARKQSPAALSGQNSPCSETPPANTGNQTVSDIPGGETPQTVDTDNRPGAAPLADTESGPDATEAPLQADVITADADVHSVNAGDRQAVADPQPSATSPSEQQNDPTPAATNAPVKDETAQTHIFWSPFRSEWAAQGFARRLTNATQIPIDIVEADPGKYRVAFDYRDESERLEHIERIESITGLQLE